MRRKKRTPNRNVGRYFALAALLIIAVALLIQSLQPGERPAPSDGQQVLYVVRGEAEVACDSGAQAATFEQGERVALEQGCTVRSSAGAKVALIFDRKLLVVLGPNAELSLASIDRRQVGRSLRLAGALERGKATCWIDGGALDSANVLWQVGPAELFSDGGLFEAVAYDAAGARLTVYEGEVRAAQGDETLTVTPGQELALAADRALAPLVTAEEAPARPTLPDDLTMAPTRVPDLADQDSLPAAAQSGTLYTVRADDTLSGIAEAHGLTWQELWEANRDAVPDPEVLLAGQTLRVPPKSAD